MAMMGEASSFGSGGMHAYAHAAAGVSTRTFIIVSRLNSSVTAPLEEAETEIAAEPRPGTDLHAQLPSLRYRVLTNRHCKLRLRARTPEAASAWAGVVLRLTLAYKDTGEVVQYAAPQDRPDRYGKRRRTQEGEGPPSSAGPLLSFSAPPMAPAATPAVEVMLQMGPDGETTSAFGVLASTFRHASRPFLLLVRPESPWAPPVEGLLELVTKARRAGPHPSPRAFEGAKLEEEAPTPAGSWAVYDPSPPPARSQAQPPTSTPREGGTLELSEWLAQAAAAARAGPASSSSPSTSPATSPPAPLSPPRQPAPAAAAPGFRIESRSPPQPPGGQMEPHPRPQRPTPERGADLAAALEQLNLTDVREECYPPFEDLEQFGTSHFQDDPAFARIFGAFERQVGRLLVESGVGPVDRVVDLDGPGGPSGPPRAALAAASPPNVRRLLRLLGPGGPLDPAPPSPLSPSALAFLRPPPAQAEAAASALLFACSALGAGTSPSRLAAVAHALLDPALLGTDLVLAFSGRPRLQQLLYGLLEVGQRDMVEAFFRAGTARLLALPPAKDPEDAALVASAVFGFVLVGTSAQAVLPGDLLLMQYPPCQALLGKALQTLEAHEETHPALLCEWYWRKCMLDWQFRLEDSALQTAYEGLSLVARHGLSPSRLESRLLGAILTLHMAVPGEASMRQAQALEGRIYWFEEEDEECLADKAFVILSLASMEGYRRRFKRVQGYFDRAMACTEELARRSEAFQPRLVRMLFFVAVTSVHINILGSGVRSWRRLVSILKAHCSPGDPQWDLGSFMRDQVSRVGTRREFHPPQTLLRVVRLFLMIIRLSDSRNTTPLRAHGVIVYGEICLKIGDREKAAECFEEALRLLQGRWPLCFTDDHPRCARLRGLIAEARARGPAPPRSPSPPGEKGKAEAAASPGPASFLSRLFRRGGRVTPH